MQSFNEENSSRFTTKYWRGFAHVGRVRQPPWSQVYHLYKYFWWLFYMFVNSLFPIRYSHGVSSPGRHVRTRLYFTSESHLHSLLTVLRFGGLVEVCLLDTKINIYENIHRYLQKGGEGADEQWRRAMEYVSQISELNYMSQVVIMLYEDQTKDPTSEQRWKEMFFSYRFIQNQKKIWFTLTDFTLSYTFLRVSIVVYKRICLLGQDSVPIIETKALVQKLYFMMQHIISILNPFCFFGAQPTEISPSKSCPTSIPPGSSNSVCSPNCTRIEEEDLDITDVVDHSEQPKNSFLSLSVPVRASRTSSGSESPSVTPPNTLKIPITTSEPIPIR